MTHKENLKKEEFVFLKQGTFYGFDLLLKVPKDLEREESINSGLLENFISKEKTRLLETAIHELEARKEEQTHLLSFGARNALSDFKFYLEGLLQEIKK